MASGGTRRTPGGGGDDPAARPLLQPSSSSADDDDDDSASTLGPLSSAASSLRSPSPSRSTSSSTRQLAAARTMSFAAAVLLALSAGSIAVFSLYGHIFQERLHYSQFQVNGLAIAASVALYLPVSLLGYMCDRVGPAPLSFMASLLFCGGYGLAAGLYKRAVSAAERRGAMGGGGSGTGSGGSGGSGSEDGLAYAAMIVAFVAIGVATCCMYLASVATCAKNFGKGKHRGMALAVPIAAYGLSGMLHSQFASRVLYERLPGGVKGDVDVFRFFVFLAVLMLVVGLVGTFTLRIIDEEELIDKAGEELERSGILEGSALFTPGRMERGYGAMERGDPFDSDEDDDGGAGILDPAKDPENEEARLKKMIVLNAETKRFLTDRTMWFLALGFFFMIGPGEAFVNNLGTVIKTLYPPELNYVGKPTTAATHVSIVAVTSTINRLVTGSLTDLLAPTPDAEHIQISSSTLLQRKRFAVSRVVFLLLSALSLSLGFVLLASGAIQNHGERFWMVSALVGTGYGAVFSLTPIIITVIWGVENFATNWGIVAMFPALGSTVWGLVYSAVYQRGAEAPSGTGDDDDLFCYGVSCYAPTFWAMAASVWIACLLVLWAWRGRGGWMQKGIVI